MTTHIFADTAEMKIVQMLEKSGYQAYFVGGCVRDYYVSGMEGNFNYEDIDVATDASPEEAKEVLKSKFKSFDLVGAKFGVLMVDGVEIAQFRSESYEENSKGKPSIQPVRTVFEDAIRRDFTMNSLYMDSKGSVIDFSEGVSDIENKLIKAIGNPDERFNEDPSRILRMFYLAARFNFRIDYSTLESAKRNRELIKQIPDALIGKIVKKVVSYNKLSKFIEMIESAGLYKTIFPEFSHTLNKPQNPAYHDSDVFNHTLRVIKAAEEKAPFNLEMAMKAWTHDIAKGLDTVRSENKFGEPNDLEHEEVGAPMAKEFCMRLQFGSKFAKEVEFNTLFHGVRFEPHLKQKSYRKTIRKLAKACKTKEELKARAENLLLFIELDAQGFTPSLKQEIEYNLSKCSGKFLETIETEMFFISELPLKGNQVSEMWTSSSFMCKTKEVLEELVRLQPTSEEEALKFASSHVSRLEKKKSAIC